MLRARFLHAGKRLMLGLAVAGAVMLGSNACGDGGGQPTAAPARPTATTEAVRIRPRRATPTAAELVNVEVTATPAEVLPEESATPAVASGDFLLYEADEGDWSVEYPADWTPNFEAPNYQWLAPPGDAFMQVTFSPLGGEMANEDLAKLASEQFSKSFEKYSERAQVKQNDGSYRIDFNFEALGIPWDAQVFVEAHRQNLYMLLLATTQEAYDADTYYDTIDYIISSYRVPSD